MCVCVRVCACACVYVNVSVGVGVCVCIDGGVALTSLSSSLSTPRRSWLSRPRPRPRPRRRRRRRRGRLGTADTTRRGRGGRPSLLAGRLGPVGCTRWGGGAGRCRARAASPLTSTGLSESPSLPTSSRHPKGVRREDAHESARAAVEAEDTDEDVNKNGTSSPSTFSGSEVGRRCRAGRARRAPQPHSSAASSSAPVKSGGDSLAPARQTSRQA
jgi:hypothetical protein